MKFFIMKFSKAFYYFSPHRSSKVTSLGVIKELRLPIQPTIPVHHPLLSHLSDWQDFHSAFIVTKLAKKPQAFVESDY
jgi:hypothetical protein